MGFEKILGNDKIIQSLKIAIKNNTLSHAYVLDGNEKMGKETLAKAFAKLILCETPKDNDCGLCSSCISFDGGNNPDLFFIKPVKKKLGVSEVRDEIIKNIETKPFKYKYKVFIIKDAHTMTVQAQNALLKTIEEPPSFAIFILLSKNYNSFLPTILSRCILFKIKPLAPIIIEDFLLKQNIDKAKVSFYASYSRGSIGRALEIISSDEFINFREETIKDIESLDNLDLIKMYNLIDKYDKTKDNIYQILEIYLITYRDAMIFKETREISSVIQKDIGYLIKDLAKMSNENLMKKIDAILNTKVLLDQNANFNMAMECLFLKLKEK